MDTTCRLKRDHSVFRSKLDTLEVALLIGERSWFVLREISFSLSKQLKDHVRSEEQLLALSGIGFLNGCRDGKRLADHSCERKRLSSINRFFMEQPKPLLERIRPTISAFIVGLRKCMDQQESGIFTEIDGISPLRLLRRQEEPTTSSVLSEAMSIREIISEHPHVQALLEERFINCRLEKYDCLDEVAWRHGMNARELLEILEHAIASRGHHPSVSPQPA